METHDWEDRPLFEDESDASSEDGHNELTSNGIESHPNCHMQGVILGVSPKYGNYKYFDTNMCYSVAY